MSTWGRLKTAALKSKSKIFVDAYRQERREGAGGQGGGQIAPGPQAPRGLITPNASRSGGPHKVNQHFFSEVNF